MASYSLRADGRKNVVKTNEVTLPELRFVDFAYDLDERAIIALAEQPAFNGGTSFVRGRYEIHLFFVQKEIIWRRLISFSKATNVTQMTYNNILKKCIFIEHRVGNPNIRYPNVEQIRVFPFNFSEATIEPGVTGVFRNVSIDQRVVKA